MVRCLVCLGCYLSPGTVKIFSGAGCSHCKILVKQSNFSRELPGKSKHASTCHLQTRIHVRNLRNAGAQKDLAANDGLTPLLMAAESNQCLFSMRRWWSVCTKVSLFPHARWPIFRYLVEAGADLQRAASRLHQSGRPKGLFASATFFCVYVKAALAACHVHAHSMAGIGRDHSLVNCRTEWMLGTRPFAAQNVP